MKTLLRIIIFLFAIPTISQTTISGKITDEKKSPIPNVTIYIDGTFDGATSNNLGEFGFVTTSKGAQILVVSLLTYDVLKTPITIEEFKYQTLILKKNINTLDEVIITAGTPCHW